MYLNFFIVVTDLIYLFIFYNFYCDVIVLN